MPTATFITGSAGSGKSTLTKNILKESSNYLVINLDPASIHPINTEDKEYDPKIIYDIREDFIFDELLETSGLGPNALLLNSFSFFLDNFNFENLENISKNLIIDCPGQIELYLHDENFKKLIKNFEKYFRPVIVFLIDGVSLSEKKYLSSSVVFLLTMRRIWCPFIGIITKSDLAINQLEDKNFFRHFQDCYDSFHSFDMLDYIDSDSLNATDKAIFNILENNRLDYYVMNTSNVESVDFLKNEIQAICGLDESGE